MKKTLLALAAIALAFLLLLVLGSGFMKQSSVYIDHWEVSPDNAQMTIHVGVASSMGSVRCIRVHQQQGGKLYLDPYQAFGGFNGSVGAKSEYTVALSSDTHLIALYRNVNCYEPILQRDEDGTWQRVR